MPLKLSSPGVDLGIVVHDLEAMLRFYGETLGLPLIGEFPVPGGIQHRFQMGSTTIKLLAPTVAVDERPSGGGISGATGIRYWTAFCEGLEEIVAECVAAGSKIMVGLSTGSTGVRYAVLQDPDGNCFELIQR
jgi:catechol 2,3-dioxygenase-like lactoylglutathione lyase family enzyme